MPPDAQLDEESRSEFRASRELSRLESLPLDERGEALLAMIDQLEEELNETGLLRESLRNDLD